MKVGTKSVLFGAHCFLLHPWFVAWAWWRLFGFPWDPRLWILFAVHDLGYWGKPNMDGPEGETHVEWGARLMHRLFDRKQPAYERIIDVAKKFDRRVWARCVKQGYAARWLSPHQLRLRTYEKKRDWYHLSLLHSRFYAKKLGRPFSRLCVADKLAVTLEPWWFYLVRTNMSGEVHEYMKLAQAREKWGEMKSASMKMVTTSQKAWFDSMCEYLRKWVQEHKDMRPDTWTPDMKQAVNKEGVWQ